MCVKSPERCFIQKGQGVLWMFDKMQDFFLLLFFVVHLKKSRKKCQQYLSKLCLLSVCLINYYSSIFITTNKYLWPRIHLTIKHHYTNTHISTFSYFYCFQKMLFSWVLHWVNLAHPVTTYYVSGTMTIGNVYLPCILAAWVRATFWKTVTQVQWVNWWNLFT